MKVLIAALLMLTGCEMRARVESKPAEVSIEGTPARIEFRNAQIVSCFHYRLDVKGQDGVFKVYEFGYAGNFDCDTWKKSTYWDFEIKRVEKYGKLSDEWRVMWAKPSAPPEAAK